jgi:anaphase-promoting complex subunit 1
LKLLAKPISFSSSISVVVALGLLCLKSNNDQIAKQLEIPKSEFLLNWITPELLLIRTISKYLIMWDEVQPTQVWLEAQIPTFLLDIVTTHSFKFTPIHEHAFHCYHASVAGLTFVIGLKYASSYCQDAYDCLFYYYHQTTQAITSLGNVNIAAQYGFSQKLFHTIARMCTNTIISSLSLVMAGSGNKKLFSMLKTIQAQSGPDISYGSHMCVNMSIGLLFLSKGMGSLGTSDKAIAALFCSFFPLYPLCSSDNRSHLQALRHLWVLAFEDRCLITRDVDNGDAVCVPVQIVLHDDTILNEFSPFNIPDKSQIKSIQIKGPRYWDIVLPIHSINNENTIWVQRKTKYLSYTQVYSILLIKFS